MANLRVIAEIKPAGDFPVVDAPNVSVTGGKRLDVALSEAAAEVAKKANKSEVDTALASKANKSEVDAALAGKANKSEVDAAIENKADKSALEAINASVSVNTSNIQELSTESTVLSARMDEFTKLEEGSTTGDAELIDGRVSADGKTYDNIGGAIRGQVTDLKSDLSDLSDFNASPFNDGIAGFQKTKFRLGMVSPSTGEISAVEDRAISELIDISGKETHLVVKASSYNTYRIGIACYDATGNHLENVGYFTADTLYSSLSSGTKKIRIICCRIVNANLTTSDLEWMAKNILVGYGNYMPDVSIKAHYSTKVGGGNSLEKYAFLGFSSSNKATVTLNPTGNISYVGIIFKGKRYADNISKFSLDLSNCSSNDNKLIYLDPVLKKFYVCDGLAPENYKSLVNNCAFVGFVCIPQPEISISSMQMSVDGKNINPYHGEEANRFDTLEKKANIFSEYHYSLLSNSENCLDNVPLLEFTSANKASVSLTTRMNRFTVCVGAKTYAMNISDVTLETGGMSTGDNKLVYLDFINKVIHVFDGTNPANNTAKSAGFLFLGLVCIPVPEVSICKMQMSVDGRNLMMSRSAELASVRYGNKTFSVMGDSISRYSDAWGGKPAGTTGWGGDTFKSAGYKVDEIWWYRLAWATGMQINTINANAGSCCSTANPNRISGCDSSRCSSLDNGTDPDFILCEMGTNDFIYGAAIGSYDGTVDVPSDVSTFMGAYANMLKKIQTNYPNAKIFCCTIHQNLYTDYKTNSLNLPTIVNKNGVTLRDYNNAIREIAKLFGCGVIDFESCGLNIHNIADMTFDTQTNMHLHPTNSGHVLLANAALKEFR